MAVTNPIAIEFCNEEVRVLCESARALVARIQNSTTSWFAGINAMFPNDSTLVDDGRENEGVSRLTGADVNSAMGVLIAMAAASNSEILEKPTVRPLQAS